MHFSDSGTIATSGAEVNVVIPYVGTYRFKPPVEQSNTTDMWRVFDMAVNANGRISAVTPINDYVA